MKNKIKEQHQNGGKERGKCHKIGIVTNTQNLLTILLLFTFSRFAALHTTTISRKPYDR